jgi:hypothetical protein
MLERDGVAVGCIIDLASVSRPGDGQQRGRGIILMEVILPCIG